MEAEVDLLATGEIVDVDLDLVVHTLAAVAEVMYYIHFVEHAETFEQSY